MKSIFSNIAARYQGKKFFVTIASVAVGAYLIKTGNVEAGVTVITGGIGSFNIGQGIADSKQAGAATFEHSLSPISGRN